MRKKTILCFLFPILFSLSCGKEELRQTIPFASVNFTINLNGLDHSLRTPLSYKTFIQARLQTDRVGFGGLLIVSGFNGEIFAFDLACPCERRRDVLVTPNADGTAVCATCHSVFITSFGLGTVISGNAPASLQVYNVFPQGEGVFIVRH